MTDKPGFRVTRYELHDDNVIEIESIASETSELDELLELFDEVKGELNKYRAAHTIQHREIQRLQNDLATALGELRTLKTENQLRVLGIEPAGLRDILLWYFGTTEENELRIQFAEIAKQQGRTTGSKFVSDGRGGELEIRTHGDLTENKEPE